MGCDYLSTKGIEFVPMLRMAALTAGCWVALGSLSPPAKAAAPLDAVFVIDNSGSMRRNDPAFITRQVVVDFARALPPGSRLGMVVFDSDARMAEPLASRSEPAARDAFVASLSAVDFTGQLTNTPEGIERALYELRTRGRDHANKVVVLLTDGLIDVGDEVGDREAARWLRETLSQAAAKDGVRIFGIAFTESADVELIQTLALRTEGEYFRAYHADEIADVVDRIVEIVVRSEDVPPVGAAPAPPPETEPVEPPQPPPTSPPPVSAPAPEAPVSPLAVAVSALAIAVLLAGAALRGRRRTPARAAQPTAPIAPPASRPAAQLLDVARVGSGGLLPLPVEGDRLSIGRDPGGDVVIPKDTISSLHATIEYEDGVFHLVDQRSSNGTRLNGRRLPPGRREALKSGDRIDFAGFEFRFLLPHRQHAGKTVLLGGMRLAPGPASPTGTGPAPADADDAVLFRKCLERHLERVRALGAPYARFAATHFGPRQLLDLAENAERMMGEARTERRLRCESFEGQRVLYVLCVVPDSMERAVTWFGKDRGGFSVLLRDFLDSEPFTRLRCDTLCIVTYGREAGEGDAWVSLTLAPSDGSHERIDIMSVELLSEEERRILALRFDDIGQVL